MKQTRLVVFTTVLMICAFAAILYSSCSKDACNGVSCKNGGACVNGICSCPTGYTGTACEQSIIVYVNNAYTPVSITVNNVTGTIPASGFISFSGTAGASATVTASTSVTNQAGKTVGEVVTWSFTDSFPTNGTKLTVPLNIDTSYFYLKMANADPSDSVVYVKVNYATPYEKMDSVLIPNNGLTYVVGYYKAFSTTKVYAAGSYPGTSWVLGTTIPDVVNATTTVSVP